MNCVPINIGCCCCCREAYANLQGTTYAFLPCVMSTSGRIHGEFLRLLYILAHRRSLKSLPTWGTMSLALMPSPGAGLNTSGNIRLPSALATPSLSYVALTSRTPLALDSGLVHLAPLRLLMPTSFGPLPVLRHIPPPLHLVYI